MSSYVILFCSTITGIIGVLISQSEKLQKHTIFGFNTASLILIIIAVIGFVASLNDISQKNKIENKKTALEAEKLKLISNRAHASIQPTFIFISSYLSNNNHGELIQIFNKEIKDEPGENRPSPSVIEPIMDVFKSTSIFGVSNMTSDGKKLTWLGCFMYHLKETNYLCDELLKHYGDTNHQLINTIDELKNRSHTLLFMFNTVASYPGMKDIYINGVPTEQHLDFIRHYFLRFIKAQQLIREIQENN